VLRGNGLAGNAEFATSEGLEVIDLDGLGHHLFQGSDASRANDALSQWLNRVLPVPE
jgi:predicted kinase